MAESRTRLLQQPAVVSVKWEPLDVTVATHMLSAREFQRAIAVSLTKTAQSAQSAERGAMRSAFDRPTPYTLKSLYIRPATVDRLESQVYFKDFAPQGRAAGEYLQPEVYGGERRYARFEGALNAAGLLKTGQYLVPTSAAPRDAFGNVPRSIYASILSQVKAQRDAMNNTTARSKKRNRGRTEYFFGNPGGKGLGIWSRGFYNVGSRVNTVKPIFLVTVKPHYQRRFPFYDIAERTAARVLPGAFQSAVERMIAAIKRH